jgi:1-acyl-sn-glycerol-3-phosphate acyltransferase
MKTVRVKLILFVWQVGVEWEIIGKEKLLVDEAAVVVLNHQGSVNCSYSC